MTAPARDLHEELAQEHEDALIAVKKAERVLANYGGLGDEENLEIARRKLEKIAVRIRIAEGRA